MSLRILTPLILVISALLSGCSGLRWFFNVDRVKVDLTEHLEVINSIARVNCESALVFFFQPGRCSES